MTLSSMGQEQRRSGCKARSVYYARAVEMHVFGVCEGWPRSQAIFPTVKPVSGFKVGEHASQTPKA